MSMHAHNVKRVTKGRDNFAIQQGSGDDDDQDDEQASEEDDDDIEDEEDDEDEGSEISGSEEDPPWITWYVTIRGNEFFCDVDESFIQDDFNLTGLSSQVPFYDFALDMILDVEIPVAKLSDEQYEIVETAAEVLYGLIHARYILTSAGMQKMYEKYMTADFGRCPRSFCKGQPVLPNGLSDVTREFYVEVFCPRCLETYHPRSGKHANLDGVYFGTTFAHLFLLTHPELIVLRPVDSYKPRIFGFKINESSQYYTQREPNTSSDKDKTKQTKKITSSATADSRNSKKQASNSNPKSTEAMSAIERYLADNPNKLDGQEAPSNARQGAQGSTRTVAPPNSSVSLGKSNGDAAVLESGGVVAQKNIWQKVRGTGED